MMTKRKRTTIAPAYTMSWIAARNCAWSARKRPAMLRIMRRRPIALRMGFFTTIVDVAPAIASAARIQKYACLRWSSVGFTGLSLGQRLEREARVVALLLAAHV